jgi:hypothetical protein
VYAQTFIIRLVQFLVGAMCRGDGKLYLYIYIYIDMLTNSIVVGLTVAVAAYLVLGNIDIRHTVLIGLIASIALFSLEILIPGAKGVKTASHVVPELLWNHQPAHSAQSPESDSLAYSEDTMYATYPWIGTINIQSGGAEADEKQRQIDESQGHFNAARFFPPDIKPWDGIGSILNKFPDSQFTRRYSRTKNLGVKFMLAQYARDIKALLTDEEFARYMKDYKYTRFVKPEFQPKLTPQRTAMINADIRESLRPITQEDLDTIPKADGELIRGKMYQLSEEYPSFSVIEDQLVNISGTIQNVVFKRILLAIKSMTELEIDNYFRTYKLPKIVVPEYRVNNVIKKFTHLANTPEFREKYDKKLAIVMKEAINMADGAIDIICSA